MDLRLFQNLKNSIPAKIVSKEVGIVGTVSMGNDVVVLKSSPQEKLVKINCLSSLPYNDESFYECGLVELISKCQQAIEQHICSI